MVGLCRTENTMVYNNLSKFEEKATVTNYVKKDLD